AIEAERGLRLGRGGDASNAQQRDACKKQRAAPPFHPNPPHDKTRPPVPLDIVIMAPVYVRSAPGRHPPHCYMSATAVTQDVTHELRFVSLSFTIRKPHSPRRTGIVNVNVDPVPI